MIKRASTSSSVLAAVEDVAGCCYRQSRTNTFSGVTISLPDALRIIGGAERNQSWIIWRRLFGENRCRQLPVHQALDRQGQVIYVGTFGKASSRRCVWAIWCCPKRWLNLCSATCIDMRHSEVSTQVVMAEFMAAGHFQRHIRRMSRCIAWRNAVLAHWPNGRRSRARAIAQCGGRGPVHDGAGRGALSASKPCWRKPRRLDVEINGLSRYWLPDSAEPVDKRSGLYWGFAAVPEADIKAALGRLKTVWR